MSVTRHEFEHGIERLTGAAPVLLSPDRYDLSDGAGGKPASCTFVKQPDAVLGLHLRLPRVLVTLHLEVLSVKEREDLVWHFDRVFQRGGG